MEGTQQPTALATPEPQPSDATSSPDPNCLQPRLRALRDALLTGLVERDVAIRLALLAALAGEHLLLVGPPGTAKSLIARRLRLAFSGSTYFERLLTRFSVPEELFGPLSIKGLEEDRYERLTDRYLPTASVAFLDEIFKANSAILNSLLTLLNEREFDNGTARSATPLVALVGASNELPEEDDLGALYDRFLLRLHVGPVSRAGFPALLALRGEAEVSVDDALRLDPRTLEAARRAGVPVVVPDDVAALLCELRDWCAVEEIEVSDRRWRKVVKLLQISAWTNARDRVSIWDCWLLQHCLWQEPEERERIYDWYAERVGASAAMDPSRLTRILVSWEGKLQTDRQSQSQLRDSEGRLLFLDEDGEHTTDARGRVLAVRGGEPVYLAPPQALQHSGNAMPNRAGGGKGFTVAELDQLYIYDNYWGNRQFSNWPSRGEYLAEPSNRMMTSATRTAALEPTPQKPEYIEHCLSELDGLRREV